ncbi:MAG: hypothetical protein F6K62_08230 [Sphaerospermopsis sp. SIO1G2]|nr:hypothetical protein [Sphaerospermopsis sp. SIO1G2]
MTATKNITPLQIYITDFIAADNFEPIKKVFLTQITQDEGTKPKLETPAQQHSSESLTRLTKVEA